MIETGREVGRGQMWSLTHKKKDGSYVNEEAREIAVNIVFIVVCYNYWFNFFYKLEFWFLVFHLGQN